MSLWLTRAGSHGEYETRFLKDGRICLGWGAKLPDLSGAKSYDDVKKIVVDSFPEEGSRKLGNWAGQIWAFSVAMKAGDLVVTPLKGKSVIAVGKITGPYHFDPALDEGYQHFREVEWLSREVPRENFDSDLLFSFGAIMTICEIKRNDAEARVRAMAKAGWKKVPIGATIGGAGATPKKLEAEGPVDLEQVAVDQIRKIISAKFKGRGMEVLVNALLQAQGYETYLTPEGADGGKDILAAPGHLGFGHPRICVQVKSGDGQLERKTLDELMGVMKKFGAEQGVLAAWGGFKNALVKDAEKEFFTVRLWDSEKLISEVLENYGKLPEDLRAEIPLKRIWTVAVGDED